MCVCVFVCMCVFVYVFVCVQTAMQMLSKNVLQLLTVHGIAPVDASLQGYLTIISGLI